MQAGPKPTSKKPAAYIPKSAWRRHELGSASTSMQLNSHLETTMRNVQLFLCEHQRLARRHFLALGAAGSAALALLPASSSRADSPPPSPELESAIAKLESFFT